ncbi:MAG: hypothetical protein EBS19_09970, partial [Spirochaetia bacterium]|nr:hypothetical protein [Spirochaetia bacterium]
MNQITINYSKFKEETSPFQMNTILEKIRSSRSLQVRIGILYVILALVNLLFFSVLIYENQTELLVKNFNFQSVNFVLQVMDDLKGITISKDTPEVYKKVSDSLSFNEISNYIVFRSNGEILFEQNDPKSLALKEDILEKSKQMSDTSSIFTSKYSLELVKSDFSIKIIIPLPSDFTNENVFLFSQLSLKTIKERLNKLYIQI